MCSKRGIPARPAYGPCDESHQGGSIGVWTASGNTATFVSSTTSTTAGAPTGWTFRYNTIAASATS